MTRANDQIFIEQYSLENENASPHQLTNTAITMPIPPTDKMDELANQQVQPNKEEMDVASIVMNFFFLVNLTDG